MRIVPLILAGVVMAGPAFSAVSDTDLTEVTAIVATLHSVESELIRQSVLDPQQSRKSVDKVASLVQKTVEQMALSSRGCQPGFCLRDAMCVPCDPQRKNQKRTPELFQILATMHVLESELMRQFAQGSREFGKSKSQMRKLAVESAAATNGPVPYQRCQPMFCLRDGLCYPCGPTVK